MTGYIYCHTSPSGKKYIGQTTTSLEHRFNNGENYISSPVFWQAIKKYGWDNIKHQILHTVEASSKDELLSKLNSLEREEILKNNTIVPHGYNIELGGGQGRVSEEKRKRISKTELNGKAPSEEQLIELYINQNLTMAQIASKLNINRTSVSKWLKWYNIPINYKHRSTLQISYEDFKNKYIDNNYTQEQCANYFNVPISQISRLVKQFNLYKRKEVKYD